MSGRTFKFMERLVQILLLTAKKPFSVKHAQNNEPCLDENGLLAFGPNDLDDPHHWSIPRRIGISFASCLLVLNATFASSSPSGCLTSIADHFDISFEVAGLTITVFLLGYCAGPLIFAPLSEFYGRRLIFHITFTAYFAFTFLCAFAPNFGSLLVGRFLAALPVSAALSNAPAVGSDIWGPLQRSTAMALVIAMIWIGPALGPVVAGFLELKEDWRWSFYVLIWLATGSWFIMLTLPETHGPTILLHKARRIRAAKIPGYEHVKAPTELGNRSLLAIYKIALVRPWIILWDPISFFCALYMAVIYTLLYMLFVIYPIVFQQKRGWNVGVGQLPLIGTVIGAALGGLLTIAASRLTLKKVKSGQKKIGDIVPEDRMPLAMIGGIGFAVTMFWFAWTAEYDSIHWIVPTLAGVFLSTSMMLIFVSYMAYLIDVYLMYAASALAANTVVRSACGAAAPLFTRQMFDALGVACGGSLIGGVAAVLALIPFFFYKYGRRLRAKSRFAPSKVKKQLQQPDEENRPMEGGVRQPETSDTSVAAAPAPDSRVMQEETEPDEENAQDSLTLKHTD